MSNYRISNGAYNLIGYVNSNCIRRLKSSDTFQLFLTHLLDCVIEVAICLLLPISSSSPRIILIRYSLFLFLLLFPNDLCQHFGHNRIAELLIFLFLQCDSPNVLLSSADVHYNFRGLKRFF
jgi:hypothetical protein